MKLFRFDMYNWSNITAIRFAGPGIYEPGNDKPSFTLDQYAKADLAKFRSYLPKLTQLHNLYETNLSVVTTGVKRRYSIWNLKMLHVLRMDGPLKTNFFAITSPWTYNFMNLTTLVLEFENRKKRALQPISTELAVIRFPCLRNLTISRSTDVYTDFYQMFHCNRLQSLKMTENADGLRRINPQIVANVTYLDIHVLASDGQVGPLPRDIMTRFYGTPSIVHKARLT
ncbi:hypothetical protein FBU59_005381, partial [Linderina macrospora]